MLELVVVGTADRASKYDEKEKKKPIRLVAISYFPPSFLPYNIDKGGNNLDLLVHTTVRLIVNCVLKKKKRRKTEQKHQEVCCSNRTTFAPVKIQQ